MGVTVLYDIGNSKSISVDYDDNQVATTTREDFEQIFIPAVNYVEKYKWHDPSQNPDDLSDDDVDSLFVRIKIYHDEQVYEEAFRCIWRKEDKWYFDIWGEKEANWDDVINWKYIETLPVKEEEDTKELFLADLFELYDKYNISISHEDCHGSFILESGDKYMDENKDWMRGCSVLR